jgi:hypothetical protein
MLACAAPSYAWSAILREGRGEEGGRGREEGGEGKRERLKERARIHCIQKKRDLCAIFLCGSGRWGFSFFFYKKI